MFDLNTLKASATTTITLKHPVTGEILYCDDEQKDPMTWTLISKHTKEYKKLASDFARALKKEFADKKLMDLNDSEVAQMEALTQQLVIDTTMKFNLIADGEKIKFTKAKASEILSDEAYFWLKQQVQTGANDTENFILA